ncbi:helix-turn-helix domain-containing protein [Shinella zoogloeoides]|uniref:helix-turn-helix domain-containing protein n=1 Tax=Shinella zoogloeoides TaxID=352475 RepID=UPI003C70DFB2
MQIDTDLLAVGREIARFRNARRMSQEQLAELAGLHRNYVSLVERGQRNPKLKTLFMIAEALSTTPSELLANIPALASSSRKCGDA